MENRSKTTFSIHAISNNKVMRAMRPNLLQNGGDKQVLGNLNLLEDDETNVGACTPTCLPNAPSLHHSAIASTIAFAANSFASASVVPNLSPRAMKSSSLMFSVLSVVAQNIEQVALLSVHHRDDLKAASDPKAAANLTDVGSNRYHQQRVSPGPYF